MHASRANSLQASRPLGTLASKSMHAGIIHMCAHEHARECHTHACLNVYVCAGVLFAAGLPVPPVMLMCFLLMRRIRQVPSPGAPPLLGHSLSTIHIRALRCTLRLRRTRHVPSPGHVVCHTSTSALSALLVQCCHATSPHSQSPVHAHVHAAGTSTMRRASGPVSPNGP